MGISSSFTQAKLTRAISAARASGVFVTRVEIEPTGKIVLIVEEGTRTASSPNPWDGELG